MGLAEREAALRRALILRHLADEPDGALAILLIDQALSMDGLPVSRDRLLGELDWLAEQQLVTRDGDKPLHRVHLTQRGRDVAAGEARVTGVARPIDLW